MAVTHPKFKVAAVQAAPAFLDLDASIDKAIGFDRRGWRGRRAPDRFSGDLDTGLSVVDMARRARLGDHARFCIALF